jgi:hypothetical protein
MGVAAWDIGASTRDTGISAFALPWRIANARGWSDILRQTRASGQPHHRNMPKALRNTAQGREAHPGGRTPSRKPRRGFTTAAGQSHTYRSSISNPYFLHNRRNSS